MNYETITLLDCIENYLMKGQAAIINDGQVVGFVDERGKTAC